MYINIIGKSQSKKSKEECLAINSKFPLKIILKSHFFVGGFEFIVNSNCTIKDIKLSVIRLHYKDLIKSNELIVEDLLNYHRILGPKKNSHNLMCSHLPDSKTVLEVRLEENDELYMLRILPAYKTIGKQKNRRELDMEDVLDHKLDEEIAKRIRKIEKNRLKETNTITSDRLQELQLSEFSSEVRRVLTPFLEIAIITLSNMPRYSKARKALEMFRNEIINTLFPNPLNQAYIIEFRDKGYSSKRTKYAFFCNKNRTSEVLAWLKKHESMDSVDIPENDFQNEIDLNRNRLMSGSSLSDTALLLKLFKDYRTYTFKPDAIAVNCLTDLGYSRTEISNALEQTENSYSCALRVLSNDKSPSLSNMEQVPYPNRLYKTLCEKVLKLYLFDAKILIALLAFYKSPEEIIFGWCFDQEVAPVIFEMFELYQFETQDIFNCNRKYVTNENNATCSTRN